MKWPMKSLCFAVAGSLLSGCAATTPPPRTSLAQDPAIRTIHAAVDRVQQETEILAQVEVGKHPAARPPSQPNTSALKTPIYIRDWNGPALQAVRLVAKKIGYHVTLTGFEPATPPIVTLDARGQQAFEVLQRIADQGQKAFDVIIDVKKQLITVRYKNKGV